MLHLQIFTDGSVNTELKFGYGAYFVVSDPDIPVDSLKEYGENKALYAN